MNFLHSPARSLCHGLWTAGKPACVPGGNRPAGLCTRSSARGASEMMLSLQALAPALNRLCARRTHIHAEPEGLCGQLRAATRRPGLAARAAWETLADRVEQLLAQDGGDGYWTA